MTAAVGNAPATVRERLEAAGLQLPQPLPAKGRYASVRHLGVQAWVAGHTGRTSDGPLYVGVVGDDVSVEQARQEARAAALNMLAALDGAGLLERVSGVLLLRGLVRARGDFGDHPHVVDAASEVLLAAFGEKVGMHARTAFGVASLPGGAPVELELVVEVGEG